MPDKRDYYEVLELGRDATFEEIKKAYRRLAVRHHPDKNPGDREAEERFKEISEAYDVLGDEEKRDLYDRFGHAVFAQGGAGAAGGFHDPFEMFRSVIGRMGGGIFEQIFGVGDGSHRGGQLAGDNLRYDLELSLEEVAEGCEKEITLRKLVPCTACDATGGGADTVIERCRVCGGAGQVAHSRGFFQFRQTCPSCRGRGEAIRNPCRTCGGDGRVETRSRVKLKIPAGIEDNNRLRLDGGGEAGVRGGPSGDLYVFVHVRPHDVFERDRADLACEIPVDFPTAALGGDLDVPTLSGKTTVRLPAGTQGGTVFRVRGRGLPNLHSREKGDLLVRIVIEVPTRLGPEQRRALEAFAASCDRRNLPLHQRFIERAKRFFQQ